MISFNMEHCYVIRLFQFSIRLSLLVLSSSNKVYFVIAHEITHAFDDVGIQYDSQGSYKPLYDKKPNIIMRIFWDDFDTKCDKVPDLMICIFI